MVPEISLTPQTVNRFIARFGKEKIAVLHSKLSIGERFDQWHKIKEGKAKIVIGARSAIFAPVQNLGLVIIDEELNTPQCFIPIRPVVLNGDDLTVIIRGDLAIPYANAFLENFKTVTADELQSEFGGGLTACAGVAFIKSSYPFYYGYALAEDLCTRAKAKAKKLNEDLAPSCLMFHKVQDSFVENYEEIIERELTPSVGLSFEFGPYFIHKQAEYWTIDELLDSHKKLTGEEGNVIKSHLRKWVELLYVAQEDMINCNNDTVGNGLAEQYLNRFKSLLSDKSLSSSEELTTGRRDMRVRNHIEKTIKTYPTYDVLALHSIYEVVTK